MNTNQKPNAPLSLEDARAKVIQSYESQFGGEPDYPTSLAIDMAAKRVAMGESFKWIQKNKNWRVIEFTKEVISISLVP
jgi:hypothetical protein